MSNNITDTCGNCRRPWPCGCADPVRVCPVAVSAGAEPQINTNYEPFLQQLEDEYGHGWKYWPQLNYLLAQLRQAEAERDEAIEAVKELMQNTHDDVVKDLTRRNAEMAAHGFGQGLELATLQAQLRQAEVERNAAIDTLDGVRNDLADLTERWQTLNAVYAKSAAREATLRADRDRANAQAFTAQTECDRLKAALERIRDGWGYSPSALRRWADQALIATPTTAPRQSREPSKCPPHYWFDDIPEAGCEICGLTRDEVSPATPDPIEGQARATTKCTHCGKERTDGLTLCPGYECYETDEQERAHVEQLVEVEARAMIEAWKAEGNSYIWRSFSGCTAHPLPNGASGDWQCECWPIDTPEAMAMVEAMLRAQKEQDASE